MRVVLAGLTAVSVVGLASAALAKGSFQGAYVGVYTAFDVTNLAFRIPGEGSFDGLGGQTFFAGGLLGFNHTIMPRLVVGAEIGGSFAHGGTDFFVTDGSDYFHASVETDWSASVRAHIGVLLTPDTEFFLSGGAVAAHASWGCDSNATSCPPREQEQLYGWLFAGIGAETTIGNGWRLRYEYQTEFFRPLTFDVGVPLEVTPLSGAARVALIRDLGMPTTRSAPAGYGYAPDMWTGVYIGGAGGRSMAISDVKVSDGPDQLTFKGFGGHGWTGGGFAGFNIQLGQMARVVAGGEAGYYWTNVKTTTSADGLGSVDIGLDSFYDFRGRLGLIVNPSTMVYAFGGLVHGNAVGTVRDDTGAVLGRERLVRTGLEGGGGIEAWLSPNLSARAEYGYAFYNNALFGAPVDEFSLNTGVGTATLGLVLHLPAMPLR